MTPTWAPAAAPAPRAPAVPEAAGHPPGPPGPAAPLGIPNPDLGSPQQQPVCLSSSGSATGSCACPTATMAPAASPAASGGESSSCSAEASLHLGLGILFFSCSLCPPRAVVGAAAAPGTRVLGQDEARGAERQRGLHRHQRRGWGLNAPAAARTRGAGVAGCSMAPRLWSWGGK